MKLHNAKRSPPTSNGGRTSGKSSRHKQYLGKQVGQVYGRIKLSIKDIFTLFRRVSCFDIRKDSAKTKNLLGKKSDNIGKPKSFHEDAGFQQDYKSDKIKRLKLKQRKISYIRIKSKEGRFFFGRKYIPTYYSQDKETDNLNGKAKRLRNGKEEDVVCRHLAFDYARQRKTECGKNIFEKINSLEKLQSSETVADQKLLDEAFNGKCCKEGYYFTLDKFPAALEDLAKRHWSLPDKEKRSYIFGSINHSMSITIKKRGDALRINCYDPNDTTRHKTFILSQPDEAKSLTINHFLSREKQDLYFPQKPASASLLSIETTAQRDDSVVFHYGPFNEIVLHMCLRSGHYGHKGLPKFTPSSCTHLSSSKNTTFLQACDESGTPGLCMAMLRNHAEAICDFVTPITNSNNDLERNDKIKLLEARNQFGMPGLMIACIKNNGEAVRTFITLVTDSNNGLNRDDKVKLLEAHDTDGNTGLSMAFLRNNGKVIKTFVTPVMNSNNGLERNDKIKLLEARNQFGMPGLMVACIKNNAEAVITFITLVTDNNNGLKRDAKVKLLESRDRDGNTGLSAAFVRNNGKMIKTFVTPVMNSSNGLERNDKIKLLEARNQFGMQGLMVACINNNAEAVRTFVTLVTDSNNGLDSDDKVKLLQSCGEDEKPGLHAAFMKGNEEVIKVFTNLVLNSKDLDWNDKVKLLRACDKNGKPGLQSALYYGQTKAAEAFKQTLLQSNLEEQQIDEILSPELAHRRFM